MNPLEAEARQNATSAIAQAKKRYPHFDFIESTVLDVMKSIQGTTRLYPSLEDEFLAACDLAHSMQGLEA